MKKHILQNQKGFTMVELLVALAIFSVVIVGVIEVFGNSYKSYVVQDEIADLQQNLRMARSMIEQDLRMTGSGIGDSLSIMGDPILPITFENGGEGESDKLTINYVNWATGCGDAPTGTTLLACDELPMLTLSTKFLKDDQDKGGQSTNFEVRQDMTDSLYADWDLGCYCGGRIYEKPKLGFMAIVTDSEKPRSETFVVTGVIPNSNKVQNGPNADYDLNNNDNIDKPDEVFDNKLLNDFNAGSTIQFFHPEFAEAAVYELTTDGTLLRNDVPIADNIEDLQFAFCGDFNDDKTADCPPDITKGEWIYKDDDLDGGDLSEDDRDKIKFINISLLGRTAKTHSNDLTSKRPELGDRKAGDSDDHFRRRLLQTTIQLRNMGL